MAVGYTTDSLSATEVLFLSKSSSNLCNVNLLRVHQSCLPSSSPASSRALSECLSVEELSDLHVRTVKHASSTALSRLRDNATVKHHPHYVFISLHSNLRSGVPQPKRKYLSHCWGEWIHFRVGCGSKHDVRILESDKRIEREHSTLFRSITQGLDHYPSQHGRP